ncbi:uncharacterized protein LOC110007312 [Amborella trichopoda]|nr:uncharacterized protein LOC110007312 [Amborella trichopoda]|eukprot:XP_020523179.1 uncharacterized protein LOC110007312 [Amborella trichopoda]
MYPLPYRKAARRSISQQRPSFDPLNVDPLAIVALDEVELDPIDDVDEVILEVGEIEEQVMEEFEEDPELIDDGDAEEAVEDEPIPDDSSMDFDPAMAFVEVVSSPLLSVVHQDSAPAMLFTSLEVTQDASGRPTSDVEGAN